MNPRYPYTFLVFLIAFCGIVFTRQQLTAADLGHAVEPKDQLYGALIALATILFSASIIVIYVLPMRKWQIWASHHNGHYTHPSNLQIQPYGMVLDMLEGADETTGRPFVLMRAIQVFRNFPTTRSGLASRHFVILAEPNSSFSSNSQNADDLQILSAKQYYMRVPSHVEMTKLDANSQLSGTRLPTMKH